MFGSWLQVAVLLVAISCGVVNSNVTDFKDINNEVLFSQIQEDQLSLGDEVSRGHAFYLLVLKINEAVLRGILTRVPNRGHEDPSGIITDLYTAHGYSGQFRLPSTDEVANAKHYFNPVDRLGSINSESNRFIQEERERMEGRPRQPPPTVPTGTPIDHRDSINTASGTYIGEHHRKMNQESQLSYDQETEVQNQRYNEDRPTAQGTPGPQNGRQPPLGQNLGQGGPRDNMGYGGNDLDEETDVGCFGKLFSCFSTKRRQ